MMKQETIDKILNRWHREGDCWIWDGSVLENGYGQIRAGVKAHRFFYENLKGPIPEGLFLDHLCKNKLCVNPIHLEPVTHAENVSRGKGNQCKNGHEFSSENTFIDGKGARQCVICSRERWRNNKRENPQIR